MLAYLKQFFDISILFLLPYMLNLPEQKMDGVRHGIVVELLRGHIVEEHRDKVYVPMMFPDQIAKG